jgi:hypothetical protein
MTLAPETTAVRTASPATQDGAQPAMARTPAARDPHTALPAATTSAAPPAGHVADADDVVLQLRPGVHLAPVEGGVFVTSVRGSFVLQGGRSLFPLLDALEPFLLAGLSRAQLRASVPDPARQRAVSLVLDSLQGKGMLLPAQPDGNPYAQSDDPLVQLVFERADDPVASLRRHAAAAATVVGTGPAAQAAAGALRERGVPVTVAAAPAELDPADPVDLVTVTVQTGDTRLETRLWTQRGHWVVGPSLPSGRAGSTAAALRDRLDARSSMPGETDRSPAELTPAAARLAGGSAAHWTWARACRIDVLNEALTVTGPLLRLTPVPIASAAAGGGSGSDTLPTDDPRVGLVELEVPADTPQLPSALVRATPARAGASPVLGAGESLAEAGAAGVLHALRAAAAELVGAPEGVAAAAPDLTGWWLDALLRHPRTSAALTWSPVDRGAVTGRPARIWWDTLSAYAGRAFCAALATEPATGLSVAAVDVAGPAPAGRFTAWAPDAETALRAAVHLAVAADQAARAGLHGVAARCDTGPVLAAAADQRERWVPQLSARLTAAGVGPLRAVLLGDDPLTGPLAEQVGCLVEEVSDAAGQ